VIAPDFRGHGDSSLAPDGFYDIAAFSIDCYTLVHDVLGHEHAAVAGGDVGGVVLFDCTGPLFVPNAGHFLQWESPDTFNKITTAFCRPPAR
jgi:pimeloyl-ACP methyl ester carboxylesterase